MGTQEEKDAAAREAQGIIDQQERAKELASKKDEADTVKSMIDNEREKERLRPLSTPITQSKTAREACPNENTVTMMFPKPLFVWTDKSKLKVHFNAGVQEVPESLADHWYLVANGVKRYEGSTEDWKRNMQPRQGGPTIQEFVAAGHDPHNYPPPGYAAVSSQADVDEVIKAHDRARGGEAA